MPTSIPIHVDFYEILKKQNDILDNSAMNMEELYSTDTNKFKYKYTELKNMKFIASVCFYIYYIILFFFLVILYFTTKSKNLIERKNVVIKVLSDRLKRVMVIDDMISINEVIDIIE